MENFLDGLDSAQSEQLNKKIKEEFVRFIRSEEGKKQFENFTIMQDGKQMTLNALPFMWIQFYRGVMAGLTTTYRAVQHNASDFKEEIARECAKQIFDNPDEDTIEQIKEKIFGEDEDM